MRTTPYRRRLLVRGLGYGKPFAPAYQGHIVGSSLTMMTVAHFRAPTIDVPVKNYGTEVLT